MYTFPALFSAATMSNMTVLDTAGQYDLDMSSEATYPISFQVKKSKGYLQCKIFYKVWKLLPKQILYFNMITHCMMTYIYDWMY